MTSIQNATRHTGQALPSERTIALAFAIVSSKPKDLSIGEYIGILRQHIAKGRRSDALSYTYRHLDRSAYWQSEYKRAEQNLKAAKDENVDLRRELDELQSQLDTSKTSKKRKNQQPDARPAKKIKSNDDSLEGQFHGAGEIGDIMLRLVYDIHAALKSEDNIATDELTHHLTRAVSAIPQVVENEVVACLQKKDCDSERLRSTLIVASRAVHSVMLGFERLSGVLESADYVGKAVYEITKMFKNLVSCLERLSYIEASRMQSEELAVTSKTTAKSKAPKISNIKDIPALSMYANFLSDIVDNIKPSDANKALFEGITFCILQHVGVRFYTSIFGHPRPATIEQEIEQSNPSDDIEDDELAPPDQNKDFMQRQVRIEAPYLIHVLSRIMAAGPTHVGAFGGSRLAKAKQGTKDALAVTAKECLQRTLVNCIFGTEGQDESDLFRECLKMPAPKDEIPLPKIKSTDSQEWFKKELWRLLGWEILEREGGF